MNSWTTAYNPCIGHRGRVAAGLRARQGKARHFLAPGQTRQVVGLLFLGSVVEQQLRRAQRVRHHHRHRAGDAPACELHHHARVCERGELQTAVAFGDDHPEEALVLDEPPDLGGQVVQLLGDPPVVQHGAELLDRPIQKGLFLGGQGRNRGRQQPRPVGAAAEQLGVPPHRARLDRFALGLRHRGHRVSERAQDGRADQPPSKTEDVHVRFPFVRAGPGAAPTNLSTLLRRRPRPLRSRFDVSTANRGQVLRVDHRLDQHEPPLPRGNLQRVAKLGHRGDPHPLATPQLSEPRIRPRGKVQELLLPGDGPEDPPPAVVQEDDDRVQAQTDRVGDLDSGHLKRAIPAEDERAKAGADLGPQGAGDTVSHRRVEALRHVQAGGGHLDLDAAEETIAGVHDHRHARMLGKERVERLEERGHLHRRAIALDAARQVVVVAHGLRAAPERPLEQGLDEIALAHVVVMVKPDAYPVVDRPDRLLARDLRRLLAQLDVGQERAQAENQVSVSDPAADRRRAERPGVDAHVLRMLHGKRALGQDRRRARAAETVHERNHRLLGAEAVGLDPDDDHGALGPVDPRRRLVRRLGHLAGIALRTRQAAVPRDKPARDGHDAVDHVAVDLDVARLPLEPDGPDHFVDLFRCGAGIGDHPRRARHLTEHPHLGFDRLGLVVDERSQPILVLPGPAAHHQNGHALGKCPRDRIDDVEAPRAIRHAHHPESAGAPGIAVGRESHRGLVRQGDDVQPPALTELHEEVDD